MLVYLMCGKDHDGWDALVPCVWQGCLPDEGPIQVWCQGEEHRETQKFMFEELFIQIFPVVHFTDVDWRKDFPMAIRIFLGNWKSLYKYVNVIFILWYYVLKLFFELEIWVGQHF